MSGRPPLPPSTLEVNEAAISFYAPAQVAESCAWYLTKLRRYGDLGIPIVVTTIKASIGGELVHITYPQTGEQLAQAAYQRLLEQGVPKMALRFRAELEGAA